MSVELQDLEATFLMTGITDWGRLASDIGPRLSQHIYVCYMHTHTNMAFSLDSIFLENKKIHKFPTRKFINFLKIKI